MPLSLAEMFDRVLDPRKSRGKIHDLTPILCLAVVARLTGRTTLQGDLLTWIRAHWAIENQSHHVRDVTFAEDASRVRKGSSAEVMAALRNATIHLLKDVDALSTRAAMHRLQVHPEEAIDLLNGSQCETGNSPALLSPVTEKEVEPALALL
jgi:hypothetical protein